VKMTPPWTAQAQGARPLRLLVVIDAADGDRSGDLPPEAYDQPSLELPYGDGHTRLLEGSQAK